jgi:hypothetical protein
MSAQPPPSIHPCQRLTTPDNKQVNIDTPMIPLVQTLWAIELVTVACCQDIGESAVGLRDPEGTTPSGHGGFVEYYRGYAWLRMPPERREKAPEHAPGHRVPRPSDHPMAAGLLADARTPRAQRQKQHRPGPRRTDLLPRRTAT